MQLKQHIETEQYTLSVPADFEVIPLAGGYLSFQRANKHMGAMEVLGYYNGQTLSNLVPSGGQILGLRHVAAVPDAYEVLVRIETPSAGAERAEVLERHFYYLVPEQRLAYDLYFRTDEVSETTAVEVAKSFVLK